MRNRKFKSIQGFSQTILMMYYCTIIVIHIIYIVIQEVEYYFSIYSKWSESMVA